MAPLKTTRFSVRKKFFTVITLFVATWCGNLSAATWNVIYAEWDRESKVFRDYPAELLDIALAQTGVKYSLKKSQKSLSQSESIKQLRSRGEVNVVWASTDAQREQELLPIRIPIFKGLIGWRLFLMQSESRARLLNSTTIDSLLDFPIVQGTRWVDTRILRANGFDVKTSENYSELFLLTKTLEGALFPRSIVEIDQELLSPLANNLETTSRVGIAYPLAFYFFLNKKDKLLAKVIQDGLQKAMDKGLFDEVFYKYHKQYLERFNETKNTFIQLDNPLLPRETPLARKELWYQFD